MNHLKITTAELSKICGVSQGTVDRALNNRADINSETKKRIVSKPGSILFIRGSQGKIFEKLWDLSGGCAGSRGDSYLEK